jgi:hypothetical protein
MVSCLSSASGSQSVASKSQSQRPQARDLTKTLYQVDQQVKFLHLQAEVESLLQQLEIMKQQKQVSTFQKE